MLHDASKFEQISTLETIDKEAINEKEKQINDIHVGNEDVSNKGLSAGENTHWIQFNKECCVSFGLFGGSSNSDGGGRRRASRMTQTLDIRSSVFILLMTCVMHAVTIGVYLFLSNLTPHKDDVVKERKYIFTFCGLALVMVLTYLMHYIEFLRRMPYNYICLLLALLGVNLMLAGLIEITNMFYPVLIITIIVVVVFLIMGFWNSMCSNYQFDFTKWYVYLLGLLVAVPLIAGIPFVIEPGLSRKFTYIEKILITVAASINVVEIGAMAQCCQPKITSKDSEYHTDWCDNEQPKTLAKILGFIHRLKPIKTF